MRIDTCWSLGFGLAIVDTIRGADFQTRHMLLALEAGEPYRMACALAAAASFSGTDGGPARAQTERIVRAAETLAQKVGQPNALGFAAFAAGTADYLIGNWRTGREKCDRAAAIFRDQCAGVAWWMDTIQYFALECLWYHGDIKEFARRVPMLLDDAQARGDLYAGTNLHLGLPNAVWLMDDNVDSARRHLAEAMAGWSRQGFHIQHLGQLLAETQTDLYAGDGPAAYRRVTAAWPAIKGAFILRVQLSRIASHHQRARAALGAATAHAPGSSERRRLVTQARRDAGQIARERMAWGDPLAALLRAGAERLDGNDERAVAELAAATRGFEAAEMGLYGAVARLRHGALLGGDDGAALAAGVAGVLRAAGLRRPDRFADMLAPGF
jgi:hypothetical protein